MNWFNILKETRQIADTKTNVNLITEPIVMGDDKDCCERAKDLYKSFYVELGKWNINYHGKFGIQWDYDPLQIYDALVENNVFTGNLDTMSCEEFKEMVKHVGLYSQWEGPTKYILRNWEECENE